MHVGITKFKKTTNGTIVIGCNNESERNVLQAGLESKLGKQYKINIPRSRI